MTAAAEILHATLSQYPNLSTEAPEILSLYERLIGAAEERIGEPREGWQWFRLPAGTEVQMTDYDRLCRRGVAEWKGDPSEFRIVAYVA
jgi:hypothetical protein